MPRTTFLTLIAGVIIAAGLTVWLASATNAATASGGLAVLIVLAMAVRALSWFMGRNTTDPDR